MCASRIPPAEPGADQRFPLVVDSYGNRLALVFGNHAAGGQCPYYVASLCHHCDIGAGEGAAFDLATNRRRLEWFLSHYWIEWPTIAHLVVFNSGSVLNPVEMPPEFLSDVLAAARFNTALRVISLDSRESFVTLPRIVQIAKQLRNDQCARIIIGIESSDDRIRNDLLRKQMPKDSIRRAFDCLANAAAEVGSERVGLDVNIVIAGPGTTPQTAAADAAETARFALAGSKVSVDFNLHPYYPSRRGLERFPAHPRCSASLLLEAADAVASVCRQSDAGSRTFIGAHDEGHDTDRDGRSADAERLKDAIERFNDRQRTIAPR